MTILNIMKMQITDLDFDSISEILAKLDILDYFNARLACRTFYEASQYCDNIIRSRYLTKTCTSSGTIEHYNLHTPDTIFDKIHGLEIQINDNETKIYTHYQFGIPVYCYGIGKDDDRKLVDFRVEYGDSSCTLYVEGKKPKIIEYCGHRPTIYGPGMLSSLDAFYYSFILCPEATQPSGSFGSFGTSSDLDVQISF
jgi:hypothetical protein